MANILKTNLKGKINNLPHFKNEALLPLFEAVVNSIQAIEEGIENKYQQELGKIVVTINRSLQQNLEGFENDEIVGFEITDNGIGFNQDNWDSFLTAESIHKLEKGCKGVGRFFWLKAFSAVEIESIFQDNDSRKKRIIGFSVSKGIEEVSLEDTDSEIQTIVRLAGFKKEYQKQPSAYKTTAKIAQRILEHCLSFFITGKPPVIIIKDEEEEYNLSDLHRDIKDNILTEKIGLENITFSLSHIKFIFYTFTNA